jgi:hypothetical protein
VSSPRSSSRRKGCLSGLSAVRQGFLAGMPWAQMRATRRPPMECTLGSGSASRAASRGELVRPWGVFAGQCMTGSRCSWSRLLPGSSRECDSGLLPGDSPSCRSLRSFSPEAPAEGGAERASRLHGLLGPVLSYSRVAVRTGLSAPGSQRRRRRPGSSRGCAGSASRSAARRLGIRSRHRPTRWPRRHAGVRQEAG